MSSYYPDEMLVVLGFKVEITGAGSGTDVDSAWETCTGGSLNIEVADATPGGPTPGYKYVEELVFRGSISEPRRWISENLNSAARGKQGRFDLTIVEILRDGSDGRRFTYQDCFVTRYVFPSLSAGGTGNLYEEVAIKPIRLELA